MCSSDLLPEPIYRLRFDDTTGPPAGAGPGPGKTGTSSRPPARAKPGAARKPVDETRPSDKVTDTAVDPAVMRKVEDERQQAPDSELLSEDSRDELGERPVV